MHSSDVCNVAAQRLWKRQIENNNLCASDCGAQVSSPLYDPHTACGNGKVPHTLYNTHTGRGFSYGNKSPSAAAAD